MKLKVCGMRADENIREVLTHEPEWMGFIFYERSPRYMSETLDVKDFGKTKKVGVFVNADLAVIREKVDLYGLDLLQLHGDESVQQVQNIGQLGLPIIKVFRVVDVLPEDWQEFKSVSAYFLFDTATKAYGGSGKKFNWSLLRSIDHPFLLSGGIDASDIQTILEMDHPYLEGIDVNSRVEQSPGLKDIQKIKDLKEALI